MTQRLRRLFTVQADHRMVEAEILGKDDRPLERSEPKGIAPQDRLHMLHYPCFVTPGRGKMK